MSEQQITKYGTRYLDGDGNIVTAVTHLECAGHGCATCNGLGFTKTVQSTAKPAGRKS